MSEKQTIEQCNNVEIERKYIIKLPPLELLGGYRRSEIVQTYLKSSPAITHRVRSRTTDGITVYTETKKLRIGKMSAIEEERELAFAEYEELLSQADPSSTPIRKMRYVIPFEDFLLELDVYPQWHSTCVMEIELPSCETEVKLPSFIQVVQEVTGDKRYSNASMSRHFPNELLD